MKTLSKKILTGCMTLAMACALAVPAFAAAPIVFSGRNLVFFSDRKV